MEIPSDAYKVDDIVSGRVPPEIVYSDIESLKAEVNLLRSSMSQFLNALATIPENESQQEYYTLLVHQTQTLKLAIKDYCGKYNRLVAIINLAQIKLGQDTDNGRSGPSPQKRKRNSIGKS